jgi:threonine/homoserine/homoserine lactone efflux protein
LAGHSETTEKCQLRKNLLSLFDRTSGVEFMGIHDLWLFLAAGLLLNLTPGPDMALIVARTTQQGTRAGVAAALGVGAGAFIHIAAAAIGISAIIVASAFAFSVLKWIGALYLIYIGIQILRKSTPKPTRQEQSQTFLPAALRQIFAQGVLTNALNPKVAMFFLAFLPQFVDAEASSKVAAFVTLGLIFNVMGTTWNIAVAWSVGKLAGLTGYARAKAWLERAIGALFIGIGIRLAFAERP